MSQTISETTGQLHISNEVPALLERIDEITPMLMPRPKRMSTWPSHRPCSTVFARCWRFQARHPPPDPRRL